MKKRIAAILSTSMLITGTSLFTVYANGNMKDISGHFAEGSMTKFVNKGYIKGYEDNTFRPDNTITRAEFVTMFNRVFDLKKSSNKTFDDTTKHWAKDEIDIAYTNGVCMGKSSTSFAPDDEITREEAAKMISNYLKISDKNIDKLNKYKDFNGVSTWAINDVEGVLEKGYMVGYDDLTFKPLKNITRSETVLILDRIITKSDENLISIEKKIIKNNWFQDYKIVNLNDKKIEFISGFHEGLEFNILYKKLDKNGIVYKLSNNEDNSNPFNLTIELKGENTMKITSSGDYVNLGGDYSIASNNQIIKIAQDYSDSIAEYTGHYDKEYCINQYDYLGLNKLGISLKEVIDYYRH